MFEVGDMTLSILLIFLRDDAILRPIISLANDRVVMQSIS